MNRTYWTSSTRDHRFSVRKAPAAYVHALDLAVEWLEQTYTPITNKTSHRGHEYAVPGLEFECRLVYDPSGLILDYPKIAVRAG